MVAKVGPQADELLIKPRPHPSHLQLKLALVTLHARQLCATASQPPASAASATRQKSSPRLRRVGKGSGIVVQLTRDSVQGHGSAACGVLCIVRYTDVACIAIAMSDRDPIRPGMGQGTYTAVYAPSLSMSLSVSLPLRTRLRSPVRSRVACLCSAFLILKSARSTRIRSITDFSDQVTPSHALLYGDFKSR